MVDMSGVITREESYLFHQIDIIPAHRLVLQRFKENDFRLDYTIMNASLDGALEWFYQDIASRPELLKRLQAEYSLLQDRDRNPTKNVEVIREWLYTEQHNYFKEQGGELCADDDAATFPIEYLRPVDSGIYIGMTPIILQRDPVLLHKHILSANDRFMSRETMESYGIEDLGSAFLLPGLWYTKDGTKLVKLFGKNFAINYTNRLLEKETIPPSDPKRIQK